MAETGNVSIKAIVHMNKLPLVRQQLPEQFNIIMKKTTMDIYAESQLTVPVRLDQRKVTGGALKNSGSVEYDDGAQQGRVAYSIHYAVYVHEGTRYMTARPFLKNAFDDKVAIMETAFMSLESRLL